MQGYQISAGTQGGTGYFDSEGGSLRGKEWSAFISAISSCNLRLGTLGRLLGLLGALVAHSALSDPGKTFSLNVDDKSLGLRASTPRLITAGLFIIGYIKCHLLIYLFAAFASDSGRKALGLRSGYKVLSLSAMMSTMAGILWLTKCSEMFTAISGTRIYPRFALGLTGATLLPLGGILSGTSMILEGMGIYYLEMFTRNRMDPIFPLYFMNSYLLAGSATLIAAVFQIRIFVLPLIVVANLMGCVWSFSYEPRALYAGRELHDRSIVEDPDDMFFELEDAALEPDQSSTARI